MSKFQQMLMDDKVVAVNFLYRKDSDYVYNIFTDTGAIYTVHVEIFDKTVKAEKNI